MRSLLLRADQVSTFATKFVNFRLMHCSKGGLLRSNANVGMAISVINARAAMNFLMTPLLSSAECPHLRAPLTRRESGDGRALFRDAGRVGCVRPSRAAS
jgi:hypothetical protein